MTERILTDYCRAIQEAGVADIALERAMGSDSGDFIEAFVKRLTRRQELNNLKKREIEAALKERGLGICSHPSHSFESVEDGVFLEDNLCLVYYRGDLIVLRSDSHRHRAVARPQQEIELHCLCPKHLHKTFRRLDITEPSRYPNCPPNIISRVKERNGRLMTVIGNIDVTDMPLTITYHPGLASYLDLPWG